MSDAGVPYTIIRPTDMTGDQLALSNSQRVTATTKHGKVVGGRVKNGCQVFLNVPYGRDVPRWTDPQTLPVSYQYENKEFTKDGLYCAQPTRENELQFPARDRLGLGQPTENPFFADIYVPSGQDLTNPSSTLPVRVFIHGGFLQYGSTGGSHYNQQFFPAEQFGEIRVLLGYRVSVLGFLGASKPSISGNYGFKDCWLGLEWVRDNIASFGGDPDQVHLSGLSGGAHVVHQLLHHAARQAPTKAPFITATLHSNAIVSDPVTPESKNDQFKQLCHALSVDPDHPNVLDTLRDKSKISTHQLIEGVLSMGISSTFRGVIGSDGWVREDEMEYQHSGGLAEGLRSAGVKCVILGDVRDEDSFYRTVHPCQTPEDLLPNLERYYSTEKAKAILSSYSRLLKDATPQRCDDLMGRIMADAQVHLPVRLLASDLIKHNVPVVRYSVEMVAEMMGTGGIVSHGTDLPIHHLRLSVLNSSEIAAALELHDKLQASIRPTLDPSRGVFLQHNEEEMLVLTRKGDVDWVRDWRWPELRDVKRAVRA